MNAKQVSILVRTGLAGLACLLSLAAAAQEQTENAQGGRPLDEITVTGTSIRGQAPVGQNIVTIDRVDIEQSGAQSLQQIMSDVPMITGFGNPGQGMVGSFDGTDAWAPTIHSLGASASNGTLVLVDGHRLPLSGISHALADPSVIPPAAVERVEVLPDGASAVYGSDAVAGVLNFVTRKNFEGIELSAQIGNGSDYDTNGISLMMGTKWDGGSLVAAYAYSHRSNLEGDKRPDFYFEDHTSQGGRNFGSTQCFPATVRYNNVRYSAPYGPTDLLGSDRCDDSGFTDLIPEDERHSLLVAFETELNEWMRVHADVVYSQRNGFSNIGRGGVSTTAYGPGSTPPAGSSINPYFVGPAGATSATVEFDSNPFFGSSAKEETGQRAFFVTPGVEIDFAEDWVFSLGGTFGEDIAHREAFNQVCSFCIVDAIHGENLTTDTALNVWGDLGSAAAGGADTSASTLEYVTDSHRLDTGRQSLVDIISKVDGPIFSMPAGQAEMAIGVEYLRYGLRQDVARPGGTGPASTASQTVDTHITRDVTGLFGEILLPLASTVDLNLAVRRDDYSDFGSTTNPKIAVNWKPLDTLRIRGSWGTSFTAPALTSRGEIDTGFTTESGWGANGNNEFLPVDSTVDRTAQFLAAVNTASCNPVDGCDLGSVDGLRVTGGNKDLSAAEGETWSIGFDLVAPDFLPGLEVHITFWDALYEGMITAPTLRNIINVPGLNDRIILLPSQAEIDNWINGLPQSSVPPANPQWIWSFQQVNAFNIDAAGIDYDFKYRFGSETEWTIGLAASTKTRFDQQSGTGDIWQDFLDVDANTTFSSFDFLGVATLEMNRGGLNAKLQMNHTGAHKKLGDPLQSKVDAYTTFDLYTSYYFSGTGLMQDLNLYFQVNDLTDEKPPFYNVRQGFNTSEVNPIGRVATLGFRKSW